MRCCERLIAALLSLCAVPLFGDDFLRSGASARAVAVGGAFLPGSESALDAMTINPAGLALLNTRTVELSLAAMLARGQFVNRANSDGRMRSQGVLPYGAFGARLGQSRFTLGFSAAPELASAARWNYVDTPGGAGGVSYGPLRNNSEILAIRAAVGVGFYVNTRVQLGATFGSTYNQNKLQTAYVFQNHPALAGLKTLLDLRTSGHGWNGSFGLLARANKHLQFGVSYKTRTNIASKGVATGNAGIQFAAIGLGAARPNFRYDAQVDNVLPQSLHVQTIWSVSGGLRFTTQGEWVNWKRAFVNLPATLTSGDNPDINGLLGTNGIKDSIPVQWKDQFAVRVGVEKSWLENARLRAGYAHGTNPVPSSTLTPLTAAITRHTFSAGGGYRVGRSEFNLAYSIDPNATARTGTSAIKSAEYSNSRVKVGVQSLVLSTAIRF